jgi:hypothetical protein
MAPQIVALMLRELDQLTDDFHFYVRKWRWKNALRVLERVRTILGQLEADESKYSGGGD